MPPSKPRRLADEESIDNRVEAMMGWFLENFEDPAHSLPYESREGGYQWIWGGPYDAEEELQQAFDDYATPEEIKEAVERIQSDGTYEWSVAGHRIQDEPDDYDRGPPQRDMRYGYDPQNPNGSTIVETILYPQQDWNWAARFTFVPGDTNQPLGAELEDSSWSPFDHDQAERLEFTSVRDMVRVLLRRAPSQGVRLFASDLEESIEWIDRLERDNELFTSNAIVVHGSPPHWLDLKKLTGAGDGTVVTGILLSADSVATGGLLMLAYGGGRIFLRLVHNLNGVQDAFFETVQKRIRRSGDRERLPPGGNDLPS
jgi:hypothetical protein